MAVINTIKASGLPISYHAIYENPDNPDGNQQYPYRAKAVFSDSEFEPDYEQNPLDSTIKEPETGYIELYVSHEKALARAQELQKASDNNKQYQIIKDNILLCLNSAMEETHAQKYADALEAEIFNRPLAILEKDIPANPNAEEPKMPETTPKKVEERKKDFEEFIDDAGKASKQKEQYSDEMKKMQEDLNNILQNA